MQKRFLPTAIVAFFIVIITVSACTKLDTTTLASDLITVDNVNTFDTTLSIVATQFNTGQDSFLIGKNDNHVIGNITNDPLFGSTASAIYVQLKPTFYPFYFGNAGDTVKGIPAVGLDSAFVCLSYKGAWGDTTAIAGTETFEIYKITDNTFRDMTDTIRNNRFLLSGSSINTLVGSSVSSPAIAAQQVNFGRGSFKDSATNQIRIKLDYNFAKTLFESDSSSSVVNKAFNNDSLFRNELNGFAIKVRAGTGGKRLMYVNLGEAKTRLEFHYRKSKNGIKDTLVQSFQTYVFPTLTGKASSTGNYLKRDYTGSQVESAVTNTNNVYVQTSPGTYVNLQVQGLQDMTNRVIHRAYIIAEQDAFAGDNSNLTPPPYMYLDLVDGVNKYKPIYHDLNPNSFYTPDAVVNYYPYSNVDPVHFGGIALGRTNGTENFTRYEINITRYVQQIVTKRDISYQLRLFAPYYNIYPQYNPTGLNGFNVRTSVLPFYNSLGLGRVRLGSGSNTNHKMKLVVIYSKI